MPRPKDPQYACTSKHPRVPENIITFTRCKTCVYQHVAAHVARRKGKRHVQAA